MSYVSLAKAPFLFVLFISVSFAGDSAFGDTVLDSTPVGTESVTNSQSFVGLLDIANPLDVNTTRVEMLNPGSTFAVGDLVGRNMVNNTGSTTWTWDICVPTNAAPGSGLTSIQFGGFAFERTTDNLENGDELFWELFLNDDTVPVETTSTGNVNGLLFDFNSYSFNMADPGSTAQTTVTSASVVFTVQGFNEQFEWFATRGTLSANFTAVPEPGAAVLAVFAMLGLTTRRSRK